MRWAATALAAAVVQGIARAPHARDYTSQTWRGAPDPFDNALLGAMGAAMIAGPALYATGSLRRLDYPLPPTGRRLLAAAGVAAQAAGLWLFHRSHADLGRNWTPHVELRDDQGLVTDGVYARIRHPMYASQLVTQAGVACLLQNAVAGPASFAAFLVLYLRRAPREESLMRARFGPIWDEYARRTGGVWPRFTRERRA